MIKRYKFPEGFLWGAAVSGHQVEGNNVNSDWWAWEHSIKRQDALISLGLNPRDFESGIACDSYHRYEEDFDLAQHLGHNAHRLSIEWARIEPQEGEYSEEALAHYEKVLQSAKAHGLATFVTLHHYVSPLWFIKKGGFTKTKNLMHFIQYVQTVARRLDEYVDFWLTFNEPELYASYSYFFGIYPPQKKQFFLALRVLKNLIQAHNNSAAYLRLNFRKPVSIAFHFSDIQPANLFSSPLVFLAHYFANEYVLRRTIDNCDFIGVNYYFHHHLGLLGLRSRSHSGHPVSDLGWGIHPEGIERVLLNLRKFRKPIYITENGIADAKDTKREMFIKSHLYYVHRAIQQGADVRGYLYWSLLDNFEWEKGFAPRFGLIEIDREDFLRRRVRYSAVKYAEICRSNVLEYDR